MAIWGMNLSVGTSAALDAVIGMSGTFNPGSDGTLDSVELYFSGATDLSTMRAAVYSGGASDIDPNGALLIEDMGVGSGSSTGWNTWTSSSNPTLTNNSRLFIIAKSNAGPAGGLLIYSSDLADRGDFFTTGRLVLLGQTGSNDPALAFPVTMDNSSSGNSSLWYSYRLNYTVISSNAIMARGFTNMDRNFINMRG